MLNIYLNETAYNDTLIKSYLSDQQIKPDSIISSIQVFIKSIGGSLHPDDNSIVVLSYTISNLQGDLLVEFNENMRDTIDLDVSISGLSDALPLFGTEGEGTLLIPSEEAYGPKGTDKIPGYTPLVFEFKLLDILE